jgi:hypothetical protein
MIEDDFEQKQEAFSSANCHHFEDSEENKLIYMDLFKEYTSQIETYLEQRLQEEVPGFDMEEFYEMLRWEDGACLGVPDVSRSVMPSLTILLSLFLAHGRTPWSGRCLTCCSR